MSENEAVERLAGEPVNFSRLGDWTSWSSLVVLLLVAPFTVLCLAPFAAVAAELLPGGFWLWMTIYFVPLPLLFLPGIRVLQVFLLDGNVRKMTDEERARLAPLLERVGSRIGKGGRRHFHLMVEDAGTVNASAVGSNLVTVTSAALHGLPDPLLEAVLAHEVGHHFGLHPVVCVVELWLGRPLRWAHRLLIAVHNLLATLSRWSKDSYLLVLMFVAVLTLRAAVFVLDAVVRSALAVLLFLGRRGEYRADNVAVKLGYGPGMLAVLADFERDEAAMLAARPERRELGSDMWDTHPPLAKRIAKIQKRLCAA